MSFLNELLFGLYPYIAVVVLLLGSWIRFDRDQYSWKSGSSQMLSDKNFRVANNLFHIGIIFILCGHFVGLLTPHEIYHHFISSENKNLVAMASGGFFGVFDIKSFMLLQLTHVLNQQVVTTLGSTLKIHQGNIRKSFTFGDDQTE